jgi:uncharacterized protein involved in cysteine biosynthesis
MTNLMRNDIKLYILVVIFKFTCNSHLLPVYAIIPTGWLLQKHSYEWPFARHNPPFKHGEFIQGLASVTENIVST